MEPTPESIAAHSAAITSALSTVSSSNAAYQKLSAENIQLTGPASSASVREVHKELILNAQKLLRTIRGPYDSIFAQLENVRIVL